MNTTVTTTMVKIMAKDPALKPVLEGLTAQEHETLGRHIGTHIQNPGVSPIAPIDSPHETLLAKLDYGDSTDTDVATIEQKLSKNAWDLFITESKHHGFYEFQTWATGKGRLNIDATLTIPVLIVAHERNNIFAIHRCEASITIDPWSNHEQ